MRTLLLFFASAVAALAQYTTISDTITDASGRPVNGSITFTATSTVESNGVWVSQSPVSARIVSGVFTVGLVPTPANDCYLITFSPSSIAPRQMAAVPSSGSPLALANIVNAMGCVGGSSGPQGIPGAMGATGAPGAVGATGATGATGAGANTNGSNGQGLTGNGSGGFGTPVTFAASATTDATNAANITSGTLPHARLPALVSGDIPSNAANTTGNAGTATALASAPSLCPGGQAPTGILASGNATGCAVAGGSGPVYTVVAYSATPVFPISANTTIQDFETDLTGNVTSSTLTTTNAKTGQDISFKICQDSTGGRTFAWPANVVNPGTISSVASVCSKQIFRWDGTNAVAWTAMLNDGGSPGFFTPTAFVALPVCGATCTLSTIQSVSAPVQFSIGCANGSASCPATGVVVAHSGDALTVQFAYTTNSGGTGGQINTHVGVTGCGVTWTEITGAFVNNAAYYYQAFYAPNVAAQTCTVTVAVSGGAGVLYYSTGLVSDWAGANPYYPIDSFVTSSSYHSSASTFSMATGTVQNFGEVISCLLDVGGNNLIVNAPFTGSGAPGVYTYGHPLAGAAVTTSGSNGSGTNWTGASCIGVQP